MKSIRKNNRSGKGLAIAGLILGYGYLVVYGLSFALLLAFIYTKPESSEPPIVIEVTEMEEVELEPAMTDEDNQVELSE